MEIVNGVPTLVDSDLAYGIKAYSEDLAPDNWTKLTLQNAWADYVGGGAYRNGLYVRKEMGGIRLAGMIRSGASGTTIANIAFPPGSAVGVDRPINSRMIPVHTSGGYGALLYAVNSTSTDTLSSLTTPASPTFLNIDVFIPHN